MVTKEKTMPYQKKKKKKTQMKPRK